MVNYELYCMCCERYLTWDQVRAVSTMDEPKCPHCGHSDMTILNEEDDQPDTACAGCGWTGMADDAPRDRCPKCGGDEICHDIDKVI